MSYNHVSKYDISHYHIFCHIIIHIENMILAQCFWQSNKGYNLMIIKYSIASRFKVIAFFLYLIIFKILYLAENGKIGNSTSGVT